jgi:hypothetical protein
LTIFGETYTPERYIAKTVFITSIEPDPPINIKVEPDYPVTMIKITWDPPAEEQLFDLTQYKITLVGDTSEHLLCGGSSGTSCGTEKFEVTYD